MSRRRPLSALRSLLASEAGGGVILMAAAVLALLIANSALAPDYFAVLEIELADLSVLHWINDALMAVFFLLVGLEIKRELLEGQLSTWPRRILPGIAAAGGMVAPALIYVAINAASPATLRGWAIPTATDIAFALGVLALLGSRVPVSLKVFLTALAILDDLGAVAIIAIFYTDTISALWLGLAVLLFAGLMLLNRLGLRSLTLYLVLGVVLWFFVLRSGVHATVAGVALALAIPLRAASARSADSPLHRLEEALNPWVGFLIVPIFGFANAGVALGGMNWSLLLAPVTLGVAAGLFIGKQIGVFSAILITTSLRLTARPEGASWLQVYGVAILCGIGFTMSLFIGLLSFPSAHELETELKVGVLLGSLCSAILGSLVLLAASRGRKG